MSPPGDERSRPGSDVPEAAQSDSAASKSLEVTVAGARDENAASATTVRGQHVVAAIWRQRRCPLVRGALRTGEPNAIRDVLRLHRPHQCRAVNRDR